MRWLHENKLTLISLLAVVVMLGSGAFVVRTIDLNRIDKQQAVENERRTLENQRLIRELQRSTRVLCARGYILIDLIEVSLGLLSQRLVADIRAGNTEAVKADRQFLRTFTQQRELLTLELTDPESPCALP